MSADRHPTLVLRDDVRLIPLDRSHAAAMYRWMSDGAVAEGIGLSRKASLESTQAWLDRAASDDSIDASGVERAQRHVGNVVLDQIVRSIGSARLSVYIGEPGERGAGIGMTAVYLAVRRAFGALGLHKVWLTVHDGNVPALRCYARLGFRVDGVLRDEFIVGGERRNGLLMSMLAAELPAATTEPAR